LAPNHCAVRNSPDLQAINDAARTLEASIRQKQLIIAAKLAKCEVECSPPLPRPKPHVETDGDKARKIVTERGGKTGRLQVTLAWHTFDDLDLEIVCPLGMLAQSRYKQKAPGNCGDGKIDVDANRKMLNPVINPVENAVWENDIPELLYVRVDAYLIKSASPVDYIVTVKLDDEEKICRGAIERSDFEYVITFKPEHPLRGCDRHIIHHGVCTQPTECTDK